MKTAILAAAAAVLMSTQALAAVSPLIGTWKTNPAKSHVTGRTITYSTTSSGFHFASASGDDYDFAMNGSDFPIEGGMLASWKSTGTSKWHETLKMDGKVISTSDIELSADGNRMTESYVTILPDGTKLPGKVVRVRQSGGPGLLGTWKTKEATVDPETTIISQTSPGRLRIETPSRKETIEGPTDGKPFDMTGPGIPKDWVATFKFKDDRTLEWSGGYKDKPRVMGTNTVSSDGQVMTTEYWNVGKESEKFTEVADRQ